MKRQKERALKAKKLLKKKIARNKNQANANRQLTQEELLEEAKETELLNIESLKKFQQVTHSKHSLTHGDVSTFIRLPLSIVAINKGPFKYSKVRDIRG